MQLKILLPTKLFLKSECSHVILPATDGEICILDGHQDMIVELAAQGVVRIKGTAVANQSGIHGDKKLHIFGGIAKIMSNRCEIMTIKAIEEDLL